MQYYVTTLLVVAGVEIMAAWALNLQVGVAGVLNFAFIVFQAIGAYTEGILTLGPSSANGGFQEFVGGWRLPFPIPFICAAAAGALLSIPLGLIALRRLRADYQAVVLLVVSLIATDVITSDQKLLNGSAGLSLIPAPLESVVNLSTLGYQWFYVGVTAAMVLISYFVVHRVTASPLGRVMRAMRDNEHAATALGRNIFRLRLLALAVGGAIGGLSGAVLAGFIGTWSPGAWEYTETIVLVAAIMIGGSGNNLGAVVGAVLLPVALLESSRYLPNFGGEDIVAPLQLVLVGVLIVAFVWLRPQGIVPERRRRFGNTGAPDAARLSGPVAEPNP